MDKTKKRYWTRKRNRAEDARIVRLTRTRKRIILFCYSFQHFNGWAPNYNEIMQSCFIGKPDTVKRNLQELHNCGWITYLGNRQIRVDMLP